jgi:biopolymer transport protein ExbD
MIDIIVYIVLTLCLLVFLSVIISVVKQQHVQLELYKSYKQLRNKKETQMITANEAKQMSLSSEISLSRHLKKINTAVLHATELGNSELWLEDAIPHDNTYKIAADLSYPQLTPVQYLLQEKLTSLEYSFGPECRADGKWHLRLSW